jgi:hypothetical protein
MYSPHTVLNGNDPYITSMAVTPSDTEDLPRSPCRGLLVTAVGNLAIIPLNNADAATIALLAVAANTFIPIAARRVLATGTTATVVALY